MTVLTISTILTFAQTTTSILTMVNSHLDGWKTTTLTQRSKPYSTSHKTEDMYNTQDYGAKQNYPSIKTNPKGINVGVQFKECMQ
jgi:hypothetical protein